MDTYEKKYKEALERARVWKEKSGMPKNKQGILDDIFPELKESEDEKIRKEIINFLELPHPQFVGKRDHEKWISWLEKQGEVESDNDDIEVEEKGIREAFNKIEDEKQGKQKPDKVEPKFKVKYAGSEYNVLEIKEIAGDTYYGIEDEPNHIDYVLPDNCEIVSEQKSDWSEEDEKMLVDAYVMLDWYKGNNWWTARRIKDWLKALKERIGG